MQGAGVPVRAAAAGTVRAVRDGVADQPPDGSLRRDYGQQSCGNGVAVAHDDGWETQYCHLRQGSVRVHPGDQVTTGQPLGLVGMSGEANFPHVHLSLRHHGEQVDPFTGGTADSACGETGTPLWTGRAAGALGYVEVPIAVVGLGDRVPEHREIVSGAAGDAVLAPDRPLVGYVLAYGLRRGDRIELAILGPDGTELNRMAFPVEEDAPRASRSAGRKAPASGWPPGTYRVEASVVRVDRRWAKARSFALAQ
jgi:murein DD-endopeptidase MepM/ murein hydrolase activator NlpD